MDSTSKTTPVHAETRTPRIIMKAAPTTHAISRIAVTPMAVPGEPALAGGATAISGFIYCEN